MTMTIDRRIRLSTTAFLLAGGAFLGGFALADHTTHNPPPKVITHTVIKTDIPASPAGYTKCDPINAPEVCADWGPLTDKTIDLFYKGIDGDIPAHLTGCEQRTHLSHLQVRCTAQGYAIIFN